jgi:hypothetical protein
MILRVEVSFYCHLINAEIKCWCLRISSICGGDIKFVEKIEDSEWDLGSTLSVQILSSYQIEHSIKDSTPCFS